jgi:predicted nucleic acid-binding protein
VKRLVFVDTSAWFAFANRGDPEYRAVRTAMGSLDGLLVTSNFVFDEIVTLCLYRLGHEAAMRVGQSLLDASAVDLIRATPADERHAWELFRRRVDEEFSFTDCVSFVMMRRLGIERAVALDDDFRREGFEVVPAP